MTDLAPEMSVHILSTSEGQGDMELTLLDSIFNGGKSCHDTLRCMSYCPVRRIQALIQLRTYSGVRDFQVLVLAITYQFHRFGVLKIRHTEH
jgi:hypothetical protein